MFSDITIATIVEYVLFISCLFILAGSIFISIKTRFVQIRFFPALLTAFKNSLQHRNQKEGNHTILPYKALFTAMSTTIGIGTIVGPVIAINLGGPGALLGFLITALLGSAATYTEVGLAIKFRQESKGQILGGPMQYLKYILSKRAATWYAICGSLLMTAWSGAQANQLAAILDSPLLGDYRIPTMISGIAIALLVLFTLMGGIKRVGSLSSKLVPLMFVLYITSCLWIVGSSLDQFWSIWKEIFDSALNPYALASGSVVGGIVSSLRWGIFKGTQVTEAGVGTQTIPHSMAQTNDPITQGTLAMLSTYSAGIISFLSGFVALITKTWQDPDLPLGMSMVAASFNLYFSYYGVIIITISAILFAFGTILGNSYNGGQCFGYLTNNKSPRYYYLATALIIFLGAIFEAKLVWSVIDIGLACLVIPHMTALIIYVHKWSENILTSQQRHTEQEKPLEADLLGNVSAG